MGLCAVSPITTFPQLSPQAALTVEHMFFQGCALTGLRHANVTQTFPALNGLDISFNGITVIEAGVLQAMAPNLALLKADRNRITRLPPNVFANLRNLATINLQDGLLTALQANVLAGLPRLRSLQLRRNAITTIDPNVFGPISPASPLPISYLDLSLSPIPSLPPRLLPSLPELSRLLLTDTAITSLPANAFLNNPVLHTLEINVGLNAGIANFSRQLEPTTATVSALASLPSQLTILHLDGQKKLAPLLNSPFGDRQVWPLRRTFTRISSLDFGSVVQSLKLESMGLTSVPWLVQNAASLPSLFLDGNSITSLSVDSFLNMPSLRTLDIGFNPPLARIGAGTFAGLTSLTSLDMTSCASVCKLPSSPATPPGGAAVTCVCAEGYVGDGTFCELPCPPVARLAATPPLNNISLSTCATRWHGGICRVTDPSPMLLRCIEGVWEQVQDQKDVCECAGSPRCDTEIHCKDRHLTAVPVLFGASTLAINLLTNDIATLGPDAFPSTPLLRTLNLRNNPLTTIHPHAFRGLHQLSNLDISGMSGTAFPFPAFAPMAATLSVLRLTQCLHLANLSMPSLSVLPVLDTLLISNAPDLREQIVHPPTIYPFPALKKLALNTMLLATVPPWVRNVTTLTDLELSLNPITSLDHSSFDGLHNLRQLDLQFLTAVRTIAPDTFAPLPQLEFLRLISDVAVCNFNDTLVCTCANSDASGEEDANSLCSTSCLAFAPLEPGLATVQDCSRNETLGSECTVQCTGAPSVTQVWRCAFDGTWVLRDGPESCATPASPAPTAAPSLATVGSSSSSSSTTAPVVPIAAALGVVAVGAALLAIVYWYRRREQQQRKHILEELRQLLQIPNVRAEELYQQTYAASLGDVGACNARMRDAEVTASSLELTSTVLGEGEHGRVVLGNLQSGAVAAVGATTSPDTLTLQPVVGGGAFPDQTRHVPSATLASSIPAPSTPAQSSKVAVKMLHEGQFSGQACVNLLLEARVMAMLGSHPHLVRFLGAQIRQPPVMLVVGFCAEGDLRSFLHRRGAELQLAEGNTLLNFCQQVASAVAFLHARLIIHRDLAARNVLVQSEPQLQDGATPAFRLRLADLGLSRALDPSAEYYTKRSNARVPLKWMCPSAVALHRFTKKSDVWSFGVLAWEVFSLGTTPYENMLASEVQVKTAHGYRLPRPRACAPAVYDTVMLLCWERDEAARPSFPQLLGLLEGLIAQSRAPPAGLGVAVADSGVRSAWAAGEARALTLLPGGSGADARGGVIGNGAEYEYGDEDEDEETAI